MAVKGNILVVDDELGIREGCKRALQPQGFNVETAATINEGKGMLESHSFDLVLLDVMMPDGRGIDLLKFIHDKDPDIIGIIITGYATVELAVEAIKLGAYNFISKPFASDILLLTVNQGLERRRLSQETRRLQEVERHAAELAHAKEEIERLDQYKSAFTLTVSHELRSPVNGSLSLLRTLRRGLAGEINEQQNDILGRIENRLDLLLELINDLLVLAKSKTAIMDKPLEQVSILNVLNKIVGIYRDEAQNKKIALIVHLPDNDLLVQGTEDGYEIVFSNLIGNAIKYTPEGGQVKVVLIGDKSSVTVSVTDTGIGIPESDLPQMFEEFHRASNAKSLGITGTGLGLNIVKQYMDNFGGQVSVSSKEGFGSTFTVIAKGVEKPKR